MTGPVTSLDNPRVQAARKLLRRPSRTRAGAFLVEGPLQVAEALRSGASVREVFLAEDLELPQLVEHPGVPIVRVARRVIDALSATTTPQGAVAVVDTPPSGLPQIPEEATLVLVLAEVRDPGNAGTLVRTAAAAGADAVVFARGTVDALHPKTVRAAAGALFHVPLVRDVEVLECFAFLRERQLLLLGASAKGAPSDETDLTRSLALVVGNEAWGMRAEHEGLLDGRVSIGMPGPVESLNVASAGSILLFEIVRQRRAGAPAWS